MEGGPVIENLEHRDYPEGREKLFADLALMRESGRLADVAIFAGDLGERFEVHSCILAVRCPALAHQLSAFVASNPHNVGIFSHADRQFLEISYPSIRPRVMNMVLQYAYTGKVKLRSSDVFHVLRAAQLLDMESLARIAEQHIRRTTDVSHALAHLMQAIELEMEVMLTNLVQFISQHASEVFPRTEFYTLSRRAIKILVKQEDLSIPEAQVWNAVWKWACIQCSVPFTKSFDDLNEVECERMRDTLCPFLKPGSIRVLNMDVSTFAKQIEPLGILTAEEVLLKYRFEATVDVAPFDSAFPMNRVEFLSRIRQETTKFESTSHPHPRGITEKVQIVLPSWAHRARLAFDPRCRLGRYADLSFFEDEYCAEKIVSLDEIFAAHRVAVRSGAYHEEFPTFSIPLRRFWYVLYAPGSFDPDWGYAFQVQPTIV